MFSTLRGFKVRHTGDYNFRYWRIQLHALIQSDTRSQERNLIQLARAQTQFTLPFAAFTLFTCEHLLRGSNSPQQALRGL